LAIKELGIKDPYDLMTTKRSFTNQPRRKSRRRRDKFDRMAKVALTPCRLRNDPLLLLAISYVPLAKLRQAKTKLRRLAARDCWHRHSAECDRFPDLVEDELIR
jgi:hypothetical protein